MVSDALTSKIMRRAPILLDETDWAANPRLTEIYDEAAEWRDALAAYKDASPGRELYAIAHAVVMAASVAMGVSPDNRRDDGALQEKVGEAGLAWQRVNSMFYGAEWQQG